MPLAALTAIACGVVSNAFVPTPSAVPARTPVAPPPMKVETVPSSRTRRIALFDESQTKSELSATEKPSAHGELKSAAVPIPFWSAVPDSVPVVPPPARVDTAPVASATARKRWLPLSATKSRSRAGVSATPLGELKSAPVPIPSAVPARFEPPPATVRAI